MIDLTTTSHQHRMALFHHLDEYAALLHQLTSQVHAQRVMEAEQITEQTIAHLDQGHGRVDAEKYARLACAEFTYQRQRAEAQLAATQVGYDHLRFVIEHRPDLPD